jgi:hypothetical protein
VVRTEPEHGLLMPVDASGLCVTIGFGDFGVESRVRLSPAPMTRRIFALARLPNSSQ